MKSFKTLPNRALVCAAALALGATALAKTDLNGKLSRLKDNAENSRHNLKQYEDNLKTVTNNHAETEKALRALERQKQSLAKQTNDTQKSKVSVDVVKKQLTGYLATEKQKLDAEQKQIEEVRRALAQLETNAQKRQANIAHYEEKMSKVDRELASWSERNQSIIELEQALQSKETQARADNKRLAAKKANYEEEINKWRKQVRVSDREYANFSKIKD